MRKINDEMLISAESTWANESLQCLHDLSVTHEATTLMINELDTRMNNILQTAKNQKDQMEQQSGEIRKLLDMMQDKTSISEILDKKFKIGLYR